MLVQSVTDISPQLAVAMLSIAAAFIGGARWLVGRLLDNQRLIIDQTIMNQTQLVAAQERTATNLEAHFSVQRELMASVVTAMAVQTEILRTLRDEIRREWKGA
jgi:hypothetical protein